MKTQFHVGDVIRSQRAWGRTHDATILKIDENSKRVVCLVEKRNGELDVWAWHPAQSGVSVVLVESSVK